MFGILNLNKPLGPTSRDCVNHIQRIVKPIKVGHAGTLDPLADGVLLVLVGQAVRLTDAIHTLPKEYVGRFQLNVRSDSADTESEIVPIETPKNITRQDIESVLPAFTGAIAQTPPKFSAIWVDGKRAHELARSGKEFEVPQRTILVESLQLTHFEFPYMELTMTCSTGTYVRSLGRDIAVALGSDAVMTGLTRTAIGPFRIESSWELSKLDSASAIEKSLVPPKVGVAHWPQAHPSDLTLLSLEQGRKIDADDLQCPQSNQVSMVAAIDSQGRLRALVKKLEDGSWRADKCFLLSEF